MNRSWSALGVASALLRDARGIGDKSWVLRYFAARAAVRGRHPLKILAPGPRALAWHSAPTRLAVSTQSGGLSSWHEIAHRMSYAPTPSFRPRPGWSVIDVGANIGAYAVWAAAAMGGSGRIIAIEPNPISFERLEVSLEALEVPTTAIRAACGNADGEVSLYFEAGYTVSSSVISFAGATQVNKVRMHRLEDLLDEHGIGHVDLLKIDVEGAEEMVLQGTGAMLAAIDRVILETSDGPVDDAVRRILADGGFTLVHEATDHWGIEGLKLLAFESPARLRHQRPG